MAVIHKWPRIQDLPSKEREPFKIWLQGRDVPMLSGVPKGEQDGYYKWDYDTWKIVRPLPSSSYQNLSDEEMIAIKETESFLLYIFEEDSRNYVFDIPAKRPAPEPDNETDKFIERMNMQHVSKTLSPDQLQEWIESYRSSELNKTLALKVYNKCNLTQRDREMIFTALTGYEPPKSQRGRKSKWKTHMLLALRYMELRRTGRKAESVRGELSQFHELQSDDENGFYKAFRKGREYLHDAATYTLQDDRYWRQWREPCKRILALIAEHGRDARVRNAPANCKK